MKPESPTEMQVTVNSRSPSAFQPIERQLTNGAMAMRSMTGRKNQTTTRW
jgi:hypothetical protein